MANAIRIRGGENVAIAQLAQAVAARSDELEEALERKRMANLAMTEAANAVSTAKSALDVAKTALDERIAQIARHA